MQNVVHSSKCDSLRDNDINDSNKDHSGCSSPLSGNKCSETGPSLESLQSHFMAEASDSEEDEDCSEADSFILDHDNDNDDSDVENTLVHPENFLLTSAVEFDTNFSDFNQNTVKEHKYLRLESLLEKTSSLIEDGEFDCSSPSSSAFSGLELLAFLDVMFSNPEVLKLKELSSSLSHALDEAAVIIKHSRPRSFAEACSHGDLSTVKKLLEGRNINEVTEEGETLLSLAASSGYFEMAQLLLAMKANVEDRGLKEMTPLMEAANAGNLDIVKLLIQHGADVNAQTSQEKKTKGAKGTKELKPELHGVIPSIVCPEGNTPLMFACAAGHEEIVRILLDAGARVEEHNENGHTPLMEAASAGHVAVARLLVERGASINTHSNEFKESALTLACYKGHLEMVRFLLEAGADREHKTDEMHTALMEASMDGHVEVARLLLDSGAQVNMPADSFESPLTLAACGGHVELAMLLLDRGANIEEVNDEGYTPLMEAAREGHEEMVALLLSQGADINAQTEETQETALTLACCGGFLEVADFLIKAGADIELGASTPLMEAAQEGHLELVRYLISSGANVNATTTTGDTALTYACENGHTDVADLLLQAYAKLEHESEGGRTPLMKAARAGHLCTVQFLISKGANVNKQTTNNDHTPLSLACAGGHLSVVELLLNHGADPTHKLKDNSTMLIEASKGGHTAVVQMLLDYPNSVLANPPPADLSQISNSAIDSNEAPRVPPHGLQGFHSQDSDVNAVSNNSYLANVQAVPRIQDLLCSSLTTSIPSPAVPKQKPAQRKSTPAKAPEAPSPSFCSGTTTMQRYHYRKSNAAAQASPLAIQAETGGGTTTEPELKPSERLEQCINSMIKKAEMLHPSPEEQILQKQQILEELQRVERELQEKAQAQLLLTAQHQNLHAILSPANTQQLLINNGAVLDIESLSADPHFPQQLLYQKQQPPQVTSTTLSAEYCKARAKQANVMKPPQMPFQEPNLRNVVFDDPQQQQFILSEFTQNMTLRGTKEYCEGAIAGLMHAMGGIKLATDGTQPPAIPMYDPVTVGQALLQQQQLTQVIQQQESAKRQQQQQQPQKLLKGKPGKVQQQTLPQPNQPPLAGFQNPQAIKHLASSCGDTCTLVGNIPIDGTGVLTLSGMAAPTFPVSIAVTPGALTSPVTIASGCGASFTHNLALDEGLMVAAPARTLHETLGEIMSGPTTQLAGSHMSLLPQPCSEACLKPRGPFQPAPIYPPLDLNSQTDSNHDTALTLACGGGHEELVTLLLARGADIEHRDKKGMSPLMLASQAGHVGVVEILLNNAADIEAQADRTKDTALSSACMGGRYEVVDLLLSRGANKEHRNVSDYTPLSLAASGGYVNIIKLLLSNVAEINSRTGSKLGISPLMLAAMNGHAQAVKVLLDSGSDINAQIETNRNTALTLACFQGRNEVVSLLLDRKANVEHRAKTGLTPLMEAASGGYVEVGKVLIDKGADVNAPPVPSSRDTALTIAADKGHYRFVQLLLERDAIVEVKNKKGNSPLWLAANGGHLEVVQLLYAHNADIDSQDNRKVSCLMAAFRKGHLKIVKWMVKHVTQFPSDSEMSRFMSTLSDKEMIKKCSQCVDIIRIAKEKQAAEANKNANILLEELDLERSIAESRKAAAARRRERKKIRKRAKAEQVRAAAAKAAEVQQKGKEGSSQLPKHLASDQSEGEEDEEEDDDDEEDDEEEEEKDEEVNDLNSRLPPTNSPVKSKSSPAICSSSSPETKPKEAKAPDPDDLCGNSPNQKTTTPCEPRADRRRERAKPMEKTKRDMPNNTKQHVEIVEKQPDLPPPALPPSRNSKKRNQKAEASSNCAGPGGKFSYSAAVDLGGKSNHKHYKPKDGLLNGMAEAAQEYSEICAIISQNSNNNRLKRSSSGLPCDSLSKMGLDSLTDIALDLPNEVSYTNSLRTPLPNSIPHGLKSSLANTVSPKKWPKREEGWKEVVRSSKLFNRSKKVSVPSNAISRVIGRGGMNINAIREASGAHIEVEKQKNQGDRTVIIRGSSESTRIAQQLITALIKEPDKDLSEILNRCGLSRIVNNSVSFPENFRSSMSINPSLPTAAQVVSLASQNKNSARQQVVAKSSGNTTVSVPKTTPIPPPSLPANATPPFSNQIRSVVSNTQGIRPGIVVGSTATPPFLSNGQNSWTGVVASGKVPANVPRPMLPTSNSSPLLCATTTSAAKVSASSVSDRISPRQFPSEKKTSPVPPGSTTSTKSTVSYTLAVISLGKSPKTTVSANLVSVATKVTSSTDTKISTIAPISMDRAGSSSPSAVVHSQMPIGHGMGSGPPVQPFANSNQKLTNGPVISQPTSVAQAPTAPFASAPTPAPPSPPVVATTTSPSPIAKEYSPFSNMFAKVTQSVWGQKDKPNFASVAAAGVASVASSHAPPQAPVQSTLTLTLPPGSEPADLAKAPGYRGNLHISPGNSFGAIGSGGPRSAPCTPPLGPIGPPPRLSTPPAPSPPPAPQHDAFPPEQQVVQQSNLNPNAPDFSSRSSLLVAPALHLRFPPEAQFRPIYPMHPLRFPFHLQQQQDFGSNGPQEVEQPPMAMLNMMPQGYHPVPQHYQGMIGIRPNQRSSSTTPSVGTSSKDEGSPMAAMSPNASPQGSNLSSPTGVNVQENPAGTIGEDRKLPRPIGMERAQKKNPIYGGVSGVWSGGRSDIPVSQDWIHNMQNTMPSMQPPEEAGPIPTLHNYASNRFGDVMAMESNHNIDPTYQAMQNPGYSFMNGMPSHQIPPHLYLNNATVGQVEPSQVEMWNLHHQKVSLAAGDVLPPPQNIEHKMQQWPNWSQHQA